MRPLGDFAPLYKILLLPCGRISNAGLEQLRTTFGPNSKVVWAVDQGSKA